ncbi:MAG: hypothetical protein R2831_05550 [Chitinophagaceae bacterium]
MKYWMTLSLLVLVFSLHGQRSKNKIAYKTAKRSSIIRPYLSTSLLTMHRHSYLSLPATLGGGFGIEAGKKTSQFQAFYAGLAFNFYDATNSSMNEYLKQRYRLKDYTLYIDKPLNTLSMWQSYWYATYSYWLYRPKYVWEVFAKAGVSTLFYRIDPIVYRKSWYSNYAEYISINEQKTILSILPMLGTSFSYAMSKQFYCTVHLQMGYHIAQKDSLTEQRFNVHHEKYQQKVLAPFPTWTAQLQIGILWRPINRIKEYEKNYEDELFNKLMIKNN